MFDDDKLLQMVDTFEGQIKLANSTDENLRKQTDLFWENTFVRHLLDGSGELVKRYTGFRLTNFSLNFIKESSKSYTQANLCFF